jgi:hypothetical protein
LIARAQELLQKGEVENAEEALNQVVYQLFREPTRVNRHRALCQVAVLYGRLGLPNESDRAYQRAIGLALQADLQQRLKGLVELVEHFAVLRRVRLAFQVGLILMVQPSGFSRLLRSSARLFKLGCGKIGRQVGSFWKIDPRKT